MAETWKVILFYLIMGIKYYANSLWSAAKKALPCALTSSCSALDKALN